MTKAATSAGIARRLRRRQTETERKFWLLLRDRRLQGWKFRRQVPIGLYIADFCCPEAKLIVELDGGQHALQAETDLQRTAWLETQGYRVVRYWNNETLTNGEGVLMDLLRHLEQRRPLTLSLSHKGRGNAAANSHPAVSAAANDRPLKAMKKRSDSVPSPLRRRRPTFVGGVGEGQGEGALNGYRPDR
jgi:very-short-patch-repair endonuclease